MQKTKHANTDFLNMQIHANTHFLNMVLQRTVATTNTIKTLYMSSKRIRYKHDKNISGGATFHLSEFVYKQEKNISGGATCHLSELATNTIITLAEVFFFINRPRP